MLADGRLTVANDVYLTAAAPYEWIVTGDGIREYYVLQSMEVPTEGNTTFNAGEGPVVSADVPWKAAKST